MPRLEVGETPMPRGQHCYRAGSGVENLGPAMRPIIVGRGAATRGAALAGGLQLDEQRRAIMGVVQVERGDEHERLVARAGGFGEVLRGEQARIVVEHGAGLGAQHELDGSSGDQQRGEEKDGAAHGPA